MDFNWGALFGTFCVAVVFVGLKALFEKEAGEKMFSRHMMIEVAVLTVLFQLSNWVFS